MYVVDLWLVRAPMPLATSVVFLSIISNADLLLVVPLSMFSTLPYAFSRTPTQMPLMLKAPDALRM